MFTFTVMPDGGAEADHFEVKATSRDVYRWEHTGRGRNLVTLKDSLSMTSLYELAHIAARRQGLVDVDLAGFVDGFDLDFEEDEEPDPTQPAP